MAKGRITIDVDRCKGCELCTVACPQHILVMADTVLNGHGYHPVRIDDPNNRCTGCGLCAVICPDVCFTVYRTAGPSKQMRVVASSHSPN